MTQIETDPEQRSGIDQSGRDTTVRPQDDFYRYVNGGWVTSTEIPEDRPIHGALMLVRDQAEADLRAIIEAAADRPEHDIAAKVGDLYASFLDVDRIDALGVDPLADELAPIAAVGDPIELMELSARLGRTGVGGPIAIYVDTDSGDSTRYRIHLSQAGLGLPDESYYREDGHAEIRTAYLAHIARMLELAGVAPDPESATSAAERIMALETRLAAGHWDVVRSRDALATYNPMTAGELVEANPLLPWSAWVTGWVSPAGAFDNVVVRQPDFLETVAAALSEVDLADWKSWLAWHLVHAQAPYLSGPLVEENFDFFGRTLSGTPQLRERWKRGVSLVESALGEAAGQLYVARHFPPGHKARMVELVDNLVRAYEHSISELDWMSPETRAKALDKLGQFTPKIGYPDEWRDYSALEISREDLLDNVRAAASFETDRELAKIGSPVDRAEWFMTPQTVNAYYNPGMNEIVFPAAILQSPMFDVTADDAVNYGAIGAVIGHEIGHGFDDQGSRYDGAGNLHDWWTEQDRERFDQRANALIEQYSAFSPTEVDDEHTVNGAFTVGENIGDLGGITIALAAYQLSLDGEPAPEIDGLTGTDRFFQGWAQAWRTRTRPSEVLRRLSVDPHSPPEFRVNVVRNLDAFQESYGVREGDGMWLAPDDRVRIW